MQSLHPTLRRAFAAAALLASTAHGEVRLERLEVVLWPEYDRPAMLVMLRGWLAPEVSLPAEVPLPMPLVAGQPHAVAKRDSGGQLLLANYSLEAVGDTAVVRLLTDAREVRLEYYAPLRSSALARSYRFEWPGGPRLDHVVFEVMQPAGASALDVRPGGATSLGEDGLTYVRGDLGGRAAGEGLAIEVSYVKMGSGLTAAAIAPPAPSPDAPEAPGPDSPKAAVEPASGDQALLAALIIAGAAVLLAAAIFFRRPGRPARD